MSKVRSVHSCTPDKNGHHTLFPPEGGCGLGAIFSIIPDDVTAPFPPEGGCGLGAIFSIIPDDVTKGSPDWLLLIVKIVFLAEFHDVWFGLQEVVTWHSGEETGREGERERERERGGGVIMKGFPSNIVNHQTHWCSIWKLRWPKNQSYRNDCSTFRVPASCINDTQSYQTRGKKYKPSKKNKIV